MDVTEKIPKGIVVAAFVLAPLALVYFAYSRPGYFTNPTNLGGMVLIEFLLAPVFLYRRFFFLITILAFLFAGVDLLGGGGVWLAVRWVFLAGCRMRFIKHLPASAA